MMTRTHNNYVSLKQNIYVIDVTDGMFYWFEKENCKSQLGPLENVKLDNDKSKFKVCFNVYKGDWNIYYSIKFYIDAEGIMSDFVLEIPEICTKKITFEYDYNIYSELDCDYIYDKFKELVDIIEKYKPFEIMKQCDIPNDIINKTLELIKNDE